MILIGIDCTEQFEAMRRGEWPEPHPEVVAAHRRLDLTVELDDRAGRQDDREGQEPER